jgi:hypothetical protein
MSQETDHQGTEFGYRLCAIAPQTCRFFMVNPFGTARLIAEATEDDVDSDFQPEKEEEGDISVSQFVTMMRQQGCLGE